MKKTWWIVIVAAIVIIAVAGYLMSNQGYKPSYKTAPSTTPSQNTQSLDSYNPEVTIAEYSFIPNTVTIKTGHTVTWTNAGAFPHTITSDSGVELTSSQITAGGGTYTHTFLKSGTYTYHCSIHPSMKGTVIVVE